MNSAVQGMLIVLSGCSGTGKNSVLRELLRIHPGLAYSVSATTRPPRLDEVDGRDYYFLTENEFEAAKARGEFLEWASVYGHFYGTPRAFIEETIARRKDILLGIDVTGALHVRSLLPDAVLIFLLPPSRAELRARLMHRRTDTAVEIEKRLAQIDIELLCLKSYDYIVVNREIRTASEQIHSILVAESCAVRRRDPDAILRLLHEEEAERGSHDQPAP